jgi:hypothetical protein
MRLKMLANVDERAERIDRGRVVAQWRLASKCNQIRRGRSSAEN